MFIFLNLLRSVWFLLCLLYWIQWVFSWFYKVRWDAFGCDITAVVDWLIELFKPWAAQKIPVCSSCQPYRKVWSVQFSLLVQACVFNAVIAAHLLWHWRIKGEQRKKKGGFDSKQRKLQQWDKFFFLTCFYLLAQSKETTLSSSKSKCLVLTLLIKCLCFLLCPNTPSFLTLAQSLVGPLSFTLSLCPLKPNWSLLSQNHIILMVPTVFKHWSLANSFHYLLDTVNALFKAFELVEDIWGCYKFCKFLLST